MFTDEKSQLWDLLQNNPGYGGGGWMKLGHDLITVEVG